VNSGRVRFVYVHFPFLGSESTWAAEASECAAEQDAFWEYHDYLYDHQQGENQSAFNKENLKQWAAELGLDAQSFNECVDTGKYSDIVAQQSTLARQIGVTSTPTFLINGQPLLGAQPFEVFKDYIESALAE